MNNFWVTDMPKYSMIIFIVLNIISMILYPGGNLHELEQIGYSFTRNFFSDLGLTVSHSKVPNTYSCIRIRIIFDGDLMLDHCINYCNRDLIIPIQWILFRMKLNHR